MENPDRKSETFKEKLLHRYRLVVKNENTFEVKLAINLSRLNVFILGSILAILLVFLTTILIAFTPLKEYIPGYSSTSLKKQAVALSFKTDSLQHAIDVNQKYFSSIKKVLSGEVSSAEFNKDSIIKVVKLEANQVDLSPIKEDSILRQIVDKEDKYSLFESAKSNADFVLFPPVNGVISENYDLKNKHYAVDVVVAKDTPIKTVADGTVIFSEWTAQTGYVIIIEHSQGLISVYKHNAALVKEQGQLVKAGEVIATAGNTGELSTGPHLHFELWSNGYSVNPTNYIDFK